MSNSLELKDALRQYAEGLAKEGNFNVLKGGYFYDFRQNIFKQEMDRKFEEMFLDGDGGELTSKACAVHSSSMLGYNFFHWIDNDHKLTIHFKDKDNKDIGDNTYNKVFFEVKIPVLKGTRKANMDIVLSNDCGDWLFIESKFLEYQNHGKFDISKTYKEKPEAYYREEVREKLPSYKQWPSFISSYNTTLTKQYWEGIKQEICHLIGLTNWLYAGTEITKLDYIKDNKYNQRGEVRFINLVYEPNKNYYEHEDYKAYYDRYWELYDELKKNKLIPAKLKMGYMTYSQLWNDIKNDLPEDLKAYLDEHYMQFSQQ